MFDLKAALWAKVLRPNMHWLGRSPIRSLFRNLRGCVRQLTWMWRRHSLGARARCDGS